MGEEGTLDRETDPGHGSAGADRAGVILHIMELYKKGGNNCFLIRPFEAGFAIYPVFFYDFFLFFFF